MVGVVVLGLGGWLLLWLWLALLELLMLRVSQQRPLAVLPVFVQSVLLCLG